MVIKIKEFTLIAVAVFFVLSLTGVGTLIGDNIAGQAFKFPKGTTTEVRTFQGTNPGLQVTGNVDYLESAWETGFSTSTYTVYRIVDPLGKSRLVLDREQSRQSANLECGTEHVGDIYVSETDYDSSGSSFSGGLCVAEGFAIVLSGSNSLDLEVDSEDEFNIATDVECSGDVSSRTDSSERIDSVCESDSITITSGRIQEIGSADETYFSCDAEGLANCYAAVEDARDECYAVAQAKYDVCLDSGLSGSSQCSSYLSSSRDYCDSVVEELEDSCSLHESSVATGSYCRN